MMDGLLAALGLLTRIPVPSRTWQQPDVQARSLPWYPLVGLLIGLLLCVLAWLLQGSSSLLAAALLVAAWAWLTGGLHLDGLADMADAWMGGMGDRERTLSIMKDPCSGPSAVVTLVLVLLLKVAALASLGHSMGMAVWLAPLLARALLPAAFLSLPYVRANGMGSGLSGASRGGCVLALLLSLAVVVGLTGTHALRALLAAGLVFVLWWRACHKRLGGITGDTCGALVELVEMAVLVGLAL